MSNTYLEVPGIVTAPQLKAVAACVSKDRGAAPAVRCVRLEVVNQTVLLITVEGRYAFIGRRLYTQEQELPEGLAFNIPLAALEQMPKKGELDLEVHGDEGAYILGGVKFAPAGENKYPNWRRIVPTSASGEPANYDVGLLKLGADAVLAFEGVAKSRVAEVNLVQNGEGGTGVMVLGERGADEAACMFLIRPKQGDLPAYLYDAPGWINGH